MQHKINELALKEKVIKQLLKRYEIANQPITITEIFIKYPKENSYGEAKESPSVYSDRASLPRLIDHIHLIGHMGNEYHQSENFTEEKGQMIMKKEALNKIVRLSTNEFSLYLKEGPLSTKEFSQLLNEIEAMSAKNHPNLHLVLSSIPVMHESGKVLNCVIYAICGERPQIRIMIKPHASKKDIQYPGKENFSQADNDTVYLEGSMVSLPASSTVSAIGQDSIFYFETEGGARGIAGVDICVGHCRRHALKILYNYLSLSNLGLTSELILLQATYLLTSNSVNFHPEKGIGQAVVQNDPNFGGIFKNDRSMYHDPLKQVPTHMTQKNLFSTFDLKLYPKTSIAISDRAIEIIHPPFGSDYKIVIYPTMTLYKNGFSTELLYQIDHINHEILKRTVNYIFKDREAIGVIQDKSKEPAAIVLEKDKKTEDSDHVLKVDDTAEESDDEEGYEPPKISPLD